MSVDDLDDVLFSQDDRAEIGYGGHNDFVSKLIEKARSNNENAVKTPPPAIKHPGGRLGALKKYRRDSKEVESALRALRVPVRKVCSPGPMTRSKTTTPGVSTPVSNSKPSLDDSTETLFGAIPPTPPLKRTPKNFTPRNTRVVPFTQSDVKSSSTPVSTLSTRARNRALDRATSSSFLGLDRSTGSTGSIGSRCASKKNVDSRDDVEEDSLDDILIEATQQAEANYALSQRVPQTRSPKKKNLKEKSNDTPKAAGSGRVRPILGLKTSQLSFETKPKGVKENLRSSQTPVKLSQERKLMSSQSHVSERTKCSMEEIQRKREAALLRRKLKMSIK